MNLSTKFVIMNLLNFFGSLSKKHIDAIASTKEYITNETQFIRYLKPIFNMIYLSITSKKYGYTLSGFDEKQLWVTYHKLIGEAKNYKLTNLYIPTMKNIFSKETNVLDKESNFAYCDSQIDIRRKIEKNLNYPEKLIGLFYGLQSLLSKINF